MTNDEMLAELEKEVSYTIPITFTKARVRDLLQTAYDYNMSIYSLCVPEKNHPDFSYHVYLDIDGAWYYILFTSPEKCQKRFKEDYPNKIQLLPTYFQLLFDDVKTRKGFGGFCINPRMDRNGGIDPGYLVKLRGQGHIRILQNGRRPTAAGARSNRRRPTMTKDELWDKMDDAARLSSAEQVRAAEATLLKKAFEDNLPLLCAAVPAPEDGPGRCRLLLQPVNGKQYVVLLTLVSNFDDFKETITIPEAFLAVLESRYVMGEVFDREDVSGIVLNPRYIAPNAVGTLMINKRDLPFGNQKE